MSLNAPFMKETAGRRRRSSIAAVNGAEGLDDAQLRAAEEATRDSISALPSVGERQPPLGVWATGVFGFFIVVSLPFLLLFCVMRQVCAIPMMVANFIAGGYCSRRVSKVGPGDGYVVVTGASAGIGTSIAKILGRRGYNLVLVARRTARLEALRDEIVRSCGGHAGDIKIISADLWKPGAAAALHAEVTITLGLDVSILINNAGVAFSGAFLSTPVGTLRTMQTLNDTTCMELMHAFLKPMVKKGRGHVMNVSSIACTYPGPMEATYHATKSFLTALTRAVNYEIRHTGCSVTAVCPGFTATEFFKVAGAEGAFGHYLPFVTQTADHCATQALHAMFAGKSVRIMGRLGGAVNWMLGAILCIFPEHYGMWFVNLLWSDV